MTGLRDLDDLLRAQPRARLESFANLLGWRGLVTHAVYIPGDEAAAESFPLGVIVCYSTTDAKFNLQMHANPPDQTRLFEAAVIPDRYGMRAVGYYPFELHEDESLLCKEAERLKPLLHRSIFRQVESRRAFLRANPNLRTQLRVNKDRRKARGRR